MTIKDCIDIVDNIKPNQYTIREKVMWLSFVDETIINDVLKTHEGYDGRYDNFEGYTEDKLSVSLIVKSPYDRLYTAYLKMKIDQENGETARYNNSAALYNTYLMEFRKYYNKTHMPIDATNQRPMIPKKHTVGLSDAEYENLKKDLTYILTEHFSNTFSHDKVYAVVNEFVNNNIHLLKISPEEIKSALLEYLEKNPITENKEVYTAIVETVGFNEFNIIKGSYDELLDAYNKGLLIKLNVLQPNPTGNYLIVGCILSEYDADIFKFNYANFTGVASISWGKGNAVSMSLTEHIRVEQLNAKADKADTYNKTEVQNLITTNTAEIAQYIDDGYASLNGMIASNSAKIGDIDSALDELHNYAQALIGGAS